MAAGGAAEGRKVLGKGNASAGAQCKPNAERGEGKVEQAFLATWAKTSKTGGVGRPGGGAGRELRGLIVPRERLLLGLLLAAWLGWVAFSLNLQDEGPLRWWLQDNVLPQVR